MPTIDLELKVKEYPHEGHFRLESVGQNQLNPEIFTFYQVEEIFALLDPESREADKLPVYYQNGKKKYVLLETNTTAYEFNYRTGDVNRITKYRGDYRDNGFCWKEQKCREWAGAPADSDVWDKVYGLLEHIKDGLKKGKNELETKVKEKEEIKYWVTIINNILKKRERKLFD